jgi:hypothetical protein
MSSEAAPVEIQVPALPLDTEAIIPVTHSLAGHPLLSVGALQRLAERMPPDRLRWHLADIPVDSHFGRAATEHANGATIAQTLEQIHQARSWVYLQHIEADPTYRALLEEVFRSVSGRIDEVDPGAEGLAGWVFISSPNAVTPYHMDHEANFLMQVQGRKTISVWNPRDRSVVGETELEGFHANWSLDQTIWRESFEAKAHRIEAGPGMGVYMPFTAPHAVKNGPEVSVTFSMTFTTRRMRTEQRAFAANHWLRAHGMPTWPVGHSRVRDRALETFLTAYSLGRKAVGRARDARPAR